MLLCSNMYDNCVEIIYLDDLMYINHHCAITMFVMWLFETVDTGVLIEQCSVDALMTNV